MSRINIVIHKTYSLQPRHEPVRDYRDCAPLSLINTPKSCFVSQSSKLSISSFNVIGFLTAFEYPSWNETHTRPSSSFLVVWTLTAFFPPEVGLASLMIRPKKSRFTPASLDNESTTLLSESEFSLSSSGSRSGRISADARACRARLLWSSLSFLNS